MPPLQAIFYEKSKNGAEGDRTPDLMHAMHALSQTELQPQNVK